MRPKKWTDAEFEIVKPGPGGARKQPGWNGLGIPPNWAEWGWISRIAYLAIYIPTVLGLSVLGHWLMFHRH